MNDALANELNALLATETRGQCRHLGEATPYLTPLTYAVWTDIQKMLEVTARHAQNISQIIGELNLQEHPASFAPAVATSHYMDLAYLLPLLMDEKRRQIASYQNAIEHASATGPGHSHIVSQLQSLLADNQAHLNQLERHHRNIEGGSKLAQHG